MKYNNTGTRKQRGKIRRKKFALEKNILGNRKREKTLSGGKKLQGKRTPKREM